MKQILITIKKHLQVWKLLAIRELQLTLINRWTHLLFFTGKVVRFAVTLLMLLIIKSKTKNFASYSTDQLIVIFLTYNFVDLVAQIFFRGVYVFRQLVNRGRFDLNLTQPINPLFRVLLGKPDINDMVFFIPATAVSIYIITQLDVQITAASLLAYLFLLINSFIIALSFHIFVLCLGIVTMEVDNAIMFYRDLNRLGRFPVSVYKEPMRSLLFFLVPIGVMITIPAEILMNLTPSLSILIASAIGATFLVVSLKTWQWSLKKYESAGG